MKKLGVGVLACILAVSAFCSAQTPKPEAPKPDATTAQAQPCVIVKRHVHKFGENMSRFRPFDYVEGDYPSGFTNGGLNLAIVMFESFRKKAGR